MPVNILPIILIIAALWVAIFYALKRWRGWAAGWFVVISIIASTIHISNSGVERVYNEDMPYRIIEIGSYVEAEFTTSFGDAVTSGSQEIAVRLRGKTNQVARVVMTGRYDYGRLRAYRIDSVDGIPLRRRF
ncbi:MAG: hypothetical protein ACO1QB_01405 [Verrucomicrobiales bacterium]